jgi:hypothetical protein
MDLVADLAARLDGLVFADLTTDQVTARIIDEVVAWGRGHGWRVYRRAPSVVPLPPPLERQHSVLDVGVARADGPPLAVEVDSTDRRRTVEKLLAEAEAGRVPIWVRWSAGPIAVPPLPVRMVALQVTRHGHAYSRRPDRPPPPHGTAVIGAAAEPIPLTGAAVPDRAAAPDPARPPDDAAAPRS